MNKLSVEDRAKIIGCLVEGCSMRSTVRMTGAAKKTVSRLLVSVGTACQKFHDQTVRNVKAKLVQCDEAWSFCYAKEANVPKNLRGKLGIGDIWTWVGMDASSKLVISWRCGNRDAVEGYKFMQDLKGRLANRVQLTSDGHKAYLQAVENTFGAEIDYGMLIKLYGRTPAGMESRYSQPACIGARKRRISGKPIREFISTSFVERQNLTLRMNMRRFTRLTNGFSKSFECHQHAVALHFVVYNFVRIHQTLRITPAMEAGLTDHVWSLEEIAGLLG